MPSLNLCQFIGHVGADPEIRTFDNGNKIAITRIAVTERFLDRNNQQQEKTEWIGLVFNGKQVEVAEKYVRKGSTLYVAGRWHNREWQDQAGNKRTSSELSVTTMQLLDKREQSAQAPKQTSAPAPVPSYAPQPTYQAPPAPAPAPAYPPQPQYTQVSHPDLPF